MNKILYISSFLPSIKRKTILSEQKIYDANSAEVLSRSIFSGLSKNCPQDLEIINIAPVGPYPRCNSQTHYYGGLYNENNCIISDLGFSTIIGYQYYSIYRNLYKILRDKIQNQEYTILVYSINICVLKALNRLRKKGFQFKIVLIIPDFWEDMLTTPTIRNRIKSSITGNMQEYYSMCDAFVLLTKQMTERINCIRPYCVVEGMYNTREARPAPILKNHDIKTLFYAGMLHKKFGIGKLIEAIHEMPQQNLRLVLCGSGDYENEIIHLSKIDKRIIYKGLVERSQVLKYQYEADVLVNPRTGEDDFTKYSFPSKTIEYLASGTPSLIHRLPGIPEEYYEYCYTFDGYDKQNIINGIEKILSLSNNELFEKGFSAQRFVMDNKSEVKQTKKIVDLINNI